MNGSSGVVLATALLAAGIATGAERVHPAPVERLRPILQRGMPNAPGHALTAVEVRFPPGGKAAPHRHGSAFLFVYVTAGAVRSQIENESPRIYGTGDSWTEEPGAHHLLTENASRSQGATLLVVFVAPAGAALKTDDPAREP